MNNLEHRPLGLTGLVVSRLGLGLAALGRPGYITLNHAQDLGENYDIGAMQAHTWASLDLAWQMGINYFDAARSYGLAEQFLGAWLEDRQPSPDRITVGSKWGYTYTANWQPQAAVHEVKDHSLAVLQRQWHESRELLGDYLRLYQVHSATLESGIFTDAGVIDALARLKRQGVAIGLTLSGPAQAQTLDHALTIQVDGVRLFDVVQVTWNLLERSTSPILMAAHAAGLGVIVKEALANGRLTEGNRDPAFLPQKAILLEQADRLHTTVDALALAAVLAQPWADIVLSGAATAPQLRSNLGAFEVRWDKEASARIQPLVEVPEIYWQRRKQLAWN